LRNWTERLSYALQRALLMNTLVPFELVETKRKEPMNYSYVFGSRRDEEFDIGSTSDFGPPASAQRRIGALDRRPAAPLPLVW